MEPERAHEPVKGVFMSVVLHVNRAGTSFAPERRMRRKLTRFWKMKAPLFAEEPLDDRR